MKLFIVVASILVANVASQSVDCNLKTGSGCSNQGPFRFRQIFRRDNPWNSECSRQYQLTIEPLRNYGGYGFQCTMQMDVPEQRRYIYSMAENSFSNYKTLFTPFVYGYGLNARVASKAITRTDYNYADWYLTKAHTHSDDNHFSWVSYRVENNKMSVYTSQGMTFHGGSNALFTPTTKSTYIGLNRLYATNTGQGSGLCQIRCSVLHAFLPFGPPGRPGIGGQPGPAGPPGEIGGDAPGEPGVPGTTPPTTISPLGSDNVTEPPIDGVQGP